MSSSTRHPFALAFLPLLAVAVLAPPSASARFHGGKGCCKKLGKLEERIEALEAANEHSNAAILDLQARAEQLGDVIFDLQGQVTQLTDSIFDLQGQTTQITDSIFDLQGQVGDLQGQVGDLWGELDALQQDVEELAGGESESMAWAGCLTMTDLFPDVDGPDGSPDETLVIDGCNLQLLDDSGIGSSRDALGNLILGRDILEQGDGTLLLRSHGRSRTVLGGVTIAPPTRRGELDSSR